MATRSPPVAQLGMTLCGQCGAALPVAPDQLKLTCAFCRASVDVDPTLVRRMDMPAEARATRDEGLASLRDAYADKHGAHRGTILWAAVLCFVLWVVLLGMAELASGDSGARTAPMWSTLVFAAFVAAGFVGFKHLRARKLADAYTERARAEGHPERKRGECPECGATVMLPTITATMPCGSCRSPLIVSEGMLVRWVADAAARQAAWRSRAEAIVARAEEAQRLSRWRALGGFLVAPAAVAALALLGLKGLGYTAATNPTGDRVRFDGERGKIVARYGKLLKIRSGDDERWVAHDDTRLKPTKRPAREPDDDNRHRPGDRVRCDGTRGTRTVRETHGHMALVVAEDDSGNRRWLRDRDCRRE